MDYINILIGVLLIILGVLLIVYYTHYLKKEYKTRMSTKAITGGFGLILIGISLIIREIF